MIIEEKNLTQDQFTDFYYMYVHDTSPVALTEWIIRLLPKDELMKMLEKIK